VHRRCDALDGVPRVQEVVPRHPPHVPRIGQQDVARRPARTLVESRPGFATQDETTL
jgi:hypothetical protein